MRLRLSDCRSFAAEFDATSQQEFKSSLYDAMDRYKGHFVRLTPRPHLHVCRDGRWIDAGYGNGTHIVLHTNVFQDKEYLSSVWDRCQEAYANAGTFSSKLTELLDAVCDETKDANA